MNEGVAYMAHYSACGTYCATPSSYAIALLYFSFNMQINWWYNMIFYTLRISFENSGSCDICSIFVNIGEIFLKHLKLWIYQVYIRLQS